MVHVDSQAWIGHLELFFLSRLTVQANSVYYNKVETLLDDSDALHVVWVEITVCLI